MDEIDYNRETSRLKAAQHDPSGVAMRGQKHDMKSELSQEGRAYPARNGHHVRRTNKTNRSPSDLPPEQPIQDRTISAAETDLQVSHIARAA